MLRFIFGLIPWWIYALAAWGFGSLAVPFYHDYTRDQAELQLALVVGPPAAIPVSDFRGRGVTPLDEVHLTGMIRADLGINEIDGDTTSRTFIVIGPRGGGAPLVALITPTAQSEAMLDELLSNTGPDASVTVQGLLTSSGRGPVLGALAARGETSDLYLVEPFVNGREAGLRGKAQGSMILLAVAAGFTVVTALVALFKLRAWLRRRSTRRAARRPAAPVQAQQQPSPAATFDSPWGASTPIAKPSSAPAKPQTMPSKTRPRTAAREEEVQIPPEPAFKSVFPGGGSSFRFKSSDEIIRQSFGTFRTRKQLATRTEVTNDGD